MTYATKLARVLSGEEGTIPARTVRDVEGTVAALARPLTPEETREVAVVKAQIGKAEAEARR